MTDGLRTSNSRSLLPVVALLAATAGGQGSRGVDLEALPYAPRHLVCHRAMTPIRIDGALDEPAWRAVPWSTPFVDIQGGGHTAPRYLTRVKMLWDQDNLYIGAELEEPNLWATQTTRDSVIFRENDFEVFMDPDGDTQNYGELEVNALGTAWDLLLVRPYRDGGPPMNGWDISGLQVGIGLHGTLNQPGDRDEGWTVELALPWQSLQDLTPDHKPPISGDRWRVNFSRVEWALDVRGGQYVKRETSDGRPLPEDNWVWSPQGAVDMHMPERWGVVLFADKPAGSGDDAFSEDPNDRVKWALRRLYYRERQYHAEHGRYTADLAALNAGDIRIDGVAFHPAAQATSDLFEIAAPGINGATVHIRSDGRVWVDR